MTVEHVPVTLADAHTSVGERHVPATIVHRSARARTEEVDQELLLALDAVFPAMRPEAGELRIGPEPGQQVVRHRRDRVVATKTPSSCRSSYPPRVGGTPVAIPQSLAGRPVLLLSVRGNAARSP